MPMREKVLQKDNHKKMERGDGKGLQERVYVSEKQNFFKI